MNGIVDMKSIKSQAQFCTELMSRLNADIKRSEAQLWVGVDAYTQKQNDIKRIRRELMALSRMLRWESER